MDSSSVAVGGTAVDLSMLSSLIPLMLSSLLILILQEILLDDTTNARFWLNRKCLVLQVQKPTAGKIVCNLQLAQGW